jgi:hypothetical protein
MSTDCAPRSQALDLAAEPEKLARQLLLPRRRGPMKTHLYESDFAVVSLPTVRLIIRCWIRQHPVKGQPENSPVGRLLAKAPQHEADFSRNRDAQSAAKNEGAPRFVQNPEAWGPKKRAGKAPRAGKTRKARLSADSTARVCT